METEMPKWAKMLLSVNSKILELLLELRSKNFRDKKSRTGTKRPEAGTKRPETGRKNPETGRKNPEEELEMITPKLIIIPWSEPWHMDETRVSEIEALRIRPMKYVDDFIRRYVLRPLGPTKLLEDIIRFVLADPKNQNFHWQSKRAYIYTYVETDVFDDEGEFQTVKQLRWTQVTSKQFFNEFREKMTVCYRKLVLSHHTHIRWAERELAKCEIPLTNQHIGEILEEMGTFPSWLAREKTRLR